MLQISQIIIKDLVKGHRNVFEIIWDSLNPQKWAAGIVWRYEKQVQWRYDKEEVIKRYKPCKWLSLQRLLLALLPVYSIIFLIIVLRLMNTQLVENSQKENFCLSASEYLNQMVNREGKMSKIGLRHHRLNCTLEDGSDIFPTIQRIPTTVG